MQHSADSSAVTLTTCLWLVSSENLSPVGSSSLKVPHNFKCQLGMRFVSACAVEFCRTHRFPDSRCRLPWSTVRLRKNRKVMMNGCTIPYTPIAVDFWKSRKCSRVRLFFLTHVELDRSRGLSSCWTLPIYCSQVSKKLLIHRFQASILPHDALRVSAISIHSGTPSYNVANSPIGLLLRVISPNADYICRHSKCVIKSYY